MNRFFLTFFFTFFLLFFFCGTVRADNTYYADFEKDNAQYATLLDESQTNMDFDGDLTLEFYYKPETLSLQRIISERNAGGIEEIYVHQYNNGKITFSWNVAENNTYFITDDEILTVGVWTRISITLDVSETECHIYQDGVDLDITQSAYSNTTMVDPGATFHLGNLLTQDYTDGLLDDVRIFDDVRTPEEIDDYKDCVIPSDTENLVAYWELDNNLLDATSNNNDLTNNNSITFDNSDLPFTAVCGGSEPEEPTATTTIEHEFYDIDNLDIYDISIITSKSEAYTNASGTLITFTYYYLPFIQYVLIFSIAGLSLYSISLFYNITRRSKKWR